MNYPTHLLAERFKGLEDEFEYHNGEYCYKKIPLNRPVFRKVFKNGKLHEINLCKFKEVVIGFEDIFLYFDCKSFNGDHVIQISKSHFPIHKHTIDGDEYQRIFTDDGMWV